MTGDNSLHISVFLKPAQNYQLFIIPMILTALTFLLLLQTITSAPKQWDWRNNGGVTPVKDQQVCNAGWAFAATASYESFLLRVSGNTYDLSEQQVIQCSNQGDCSGCKNIRKTLNWIRDNGIANQSTVPYRSANYTEGKAPSEGACDAEKVKWDSKVTNREFYQTSAGRLKNLVHKGVMTVGIYMSDKLRYDYTGGVYECRDHGHYNHSNINNHAEQPWIVNQFNHYVLLVGYDSNTNFIFKNSLGTGWGDQGYGTFKKYYDCGIRIVSFEFFGPRLSLAALFIMLVMLMAVQGL